MDRVQARSRINNENTLPARNAAKNLIKPKARTALGEVGNVVKEPTRAAALPAKAAVVKKPETKVPVASTRTVFGAVKQEKPLLKPVLKETKPSAANVVKPAAVRQQPTHVTTTKFGIKPDPDETKKKPLLQKIPPKAIGAHAPLTKRPLADIKKQSPKVVHDIDLEDDPQQVAEYVNDIVVYMKDLEAHHLVPKNYLKDQKVTPHFRHVLINWMFEASNSFGLAKETFHVSVSLVDRYLAHVRTVHKHSLQLIGIAAMFIANKYEDITMVDMQDWVYICDYAYKPRDILKAEMAILDKLNFALGRPTAIAFLRRYHKVISASMRQHQLGKYFIDLGLQEYELSSVPPSIHAAAACCLAAWLIQEDGGEPEKSWSDMLVHYAGYKYADIAGTVVRYAAMILRAETDKLQAVRTAYGETKQQHIAYDCVLKSKKLKDLAATLSVSPRA